MEQKQKGKLHHYFKIIGIIVLFTHTLFMGMEILYGLLVVAWNFLKGIIFMCFDFLKLQYIVVLAIWIIILKYLTNSDLMSIQKMLLNDYNRQNQLKCQVCNRKTCQKIYTPCLHAYHVGCLERVYEEPNKRINCPACNENKPHINYFLARLQDLYRQNTFIAKIFLCICITSGIHGFYFSF